MTENAGNWETIKNDPEIFTGLIRAIGVKWAKVEELWTFHAELLKDLTPIHGLICVFESLVDDEPTEGLVQDKKEKKLFFGRQVIDNAGATQALLNVIMNTSHPDINIGKTLTDLKHTCVNFDANLKGLAISNSDIVRVAHNSFSYQSSASTNQPHFVSFVPFNNRLYELDGLKSGPLDLGAIPKGSEWTDFLRPIIDKRILKYREAEIDFNLMAVFSDKKMIYETQIENIGSLAMDLVSQYEEFSRLRSLIEYEEDNARLRQVENIRRQHNYMPFITELLKCLDSEGLLLPLYEDVKAKIFDRERRNFPPQ